MDDKNHGSPQEQLELITSLVQGSRASLRDNYLPFIVWGSIVPICYALTLWFAMLEKFSAIPFIWLVGCCLGAVLLFLYYWKKRDEEKATYISSRIMTVLWGSLMVGCLGLWGLSYVAADGLSLSNGMSLVAVMIAVGYFVTSVLTRYRLLAVGGGLWMLGGFACLFLSDNAAAALVVGLTVALELIPGIFLFRRQV